MQLKEDKGKAKILETMLEDRTLGQDIGMQGTKVVRQIERLREFVFQTKK